MNYREQYLAQGYLSPLDIIDAETAARHRQALEAAGAEIGKHQHLNNAYRAMPARRRSIDWLL